MRLIGLAIILTLTLAPLAAEAQPTPARLAMLLTGPPADATLEYAAFTKQLGDLGWNEGQNLAVDRRWADAPEKFIGIAADAVRAKPRTLAVPLAGEAQQKGKVYTIGALSIGFRPNETDTSTFSDDFLGNNRSLPRIRHAIVPRVEA